MGCAAKEPCTCVVRGCAKAASVMVVAHEAIGQSVGRGVVGQCMHLKGLCMQGVMSPQLVKGPAKDCARAAKGWPLHPGAPPARVVRPESARQREGEATAKGSQGLALATR
ncbi:hypothetical protein L7F22_002205 [Adiantum nelumboides]|nr:hypothetical protein [Adiantum nelumboides]